MKREDADAISSETLAALRGLVNRGEQSLSFDDRLERALEALSVESMFDAFGAVGQETEEVLRRSFGGRFISCSGRSSTGVTVDLIGISETDTGIGADRIGIVARKDGSAVAEPRRLAAAQIEQRALGDRLAHLGMEPDDRLKILFGIVGSALNDAERRAVSAARGQVESSGVSIPLGKGHLEGEAMPAPRLPGDPFRQRSRIDRWAARGDTGEPEGQLDRSKSLGGIAAPEMPPDVPTERSAASQGPSEDISGAGIEDSADDPATGEAVNSSGRSSLARARQRAAELHRRKMMSTPSALAPTRTPLAPLPAPSPARPGPAGKGRGRPGRGR